MKRLLSCILALIMIISIVPITAMASENTDVVTDDQNVVADKDSRYDYTAIFDLNNTRYDGRIWTDKTVSAGNLTFWGNVHELGADNVYDNSSNVTVEKGDGEEFLVSYSALASTTTVISETDAPIDLVMVLDLSPMSNSQAGKLDSLLSAVQSAATHIMDLNANNRVAIVAYSSQAEILLPLGHYDSIVMSRDGVAASQATKVTCTYVDDGTTQSNTFQVAKQSGTAVNKYTQMGIYTGMDILLKETSTSVTVGEAQDIVIRQPALILLSEGEPKLGSTKITNPTKSTVQTDGAIVTNGEAGLSTSYSSATAFVDRVEIMRNNGRADNGNINNNNRHAQTFATLLTAAYMKKAVSAHYFGTGTNSSMQVYTMGINTASANSPQLAQIVLNPKIYLAAGAPNNFSNTFINYAGQYFGNAKRVSIINAGNVQTVFDNDGSLGLNDIGDLMYNDGYYDVVGTGNSYDWDSVFDTVLSQVTQNTAKVPTLVAETDVTGHESGWLSYTDPIGDYMEVKDVKALIIDDVIYRTKSGPTSGTIGGVSAQIYTFSGTANNPVYGNHALSDIKIYVTSEKTDDGRIRQEFHVDIPAALLPLRQTTVTKDIDDNVIGFTHNNAYPFRLVYSVGLQSGVLNTDGSVNMSNVSGDYIQANTVNGEVQFYEGYYTDSDQPGVVDYDGKTVGDAYVTYTPALDNPFYYVTEDTPLYTDPKCENAATGYDQDATYYFKTTYYEAVSNPGSSGVQAVEKTEIVARPASSIREDSIKDQL